MRKLALGRSLLYFLEEIEYSEAALAADPDATAFSPEFVDAIEEWQVLFKRDRAAKRDVVRAEAQVAVRNQQIDRLTIRFAATTRALAPAVMDKVFKVAPNVFVRSNLRKQCEKTKSVIVPFVASLEAEHPLKSFASQLDNAAGAAITALDHRVARKGDAQLIGNDVVEWKEGINALRMTTYAELLKVAAAKGYPKSWVESFFRAEGNDDDEDSQSDSPAPESPV